MTHISTIIHSAFFDLRRRVIGKNDMRSNHMSDIWFDQNYVCYAYLLMHIIILRYLNTYASIISPLAFPPSKEWKYINECLVLLHGATCFVPVQIFCVGTKIYLHIVQVRNILCQTKRSFASSKVGFCASTKTNLLIANHLLVWHKIFVTDTISK